MGAEGLVVQPGINGIKDLKGKKIATPFVSTSHFQLLYALNAAGLKAADVQVLNMRPPEIAAAWSRGDIGAVRARIEQDPEVARTLQVFEESMAAVAGTSH